jgi:hypothetical protein
MGDFSGTRKTRESSGLASLALEEDMLEWKPRLLILMVLLVALASLLGQFSWILPLHFGW